METPYLDTLISTIRERTPTENINQHDIINCAIKEFAELKVAAERELNQLKSREIVPATKSFVSYITSKGRYGFEIIDGDCTTVDGVSNIHDLLESQYGEPVVIVSMLPLSK